MDAIALGKTAVREACASGADEADAYVESGKSSYVQLRNGKLDEVLGAIKGGMGLRVFKDRRCGFVYTSELSEDSVRRAARSAVEAATFAGDDPYSGVPAAGTPPSADLGLLDESVEKLGENDKIEWVRKLEGDVRKKDKRIVATDFVRYQDEVATSTLVNSRGFAEAFKSSVAFAFVVVVASDGTDRRMGFGMRAARGRDALSREEVIEEAVAKAAEPLSGKPIAPEKLPVVMHPSVAAEFLRFVGMGLSGHEVQMGRSVFAGKCGEAIGSEAFTLVDDATLPGRIGSGLFDGEGIPGRRKTLIDKGRLSMYLHHHASAQRGKTESTGNAERSYRSLPVISPSNLVVTPGKRSFEEILGSIDRGFYMMEANNVGGIRISTGDYSVASSGWLIEKGKLSRPVDKVTVGGTIFGILSGVREVGRDPIWYASVGTPCLLVEGLTVAG